MKLCKLVGVSLAIVLFCTRGGFAQKQLTVDDLYTNPDLQSKSVAGLQWMPDGKMFTYFQRDGNKLNIWSFDVRTKNREIFINSDEVSVLQGQAQEKRFSLRNYFWSPNQHEILLPSGNDLYLYATKTKELRRLTNDDAVERDPLFAPDGQRLVYVKNDNLVLLDIATGSERQLTTAGGGHILVGRFDWVYEEEFGIRTGFAWSPDGKSIAYWQLDETRVPEFPIVDFVPVHNATETMRYPKAGDANSIVKIGVVDVETAKTTWMDLGDNDDIYLPRLEWTQDPGVLCMTRLNRDQNHLELLLADAHTGKTRLLLEEREQNGWIGITDDLRFLDDGRHFLWTSERSGWNHAYLGDMQTGALEPITQGEWELAAIVGVDEKNKTLYYLSDEISTGGRQLFSIRFDGTRRMRISQQPGTHSIIMSPDFRYYIDSYSETTRPLFVSLRRINGAREAIIEANEMPALKAYGLKPPEFLTVPAADGTPLHAFMIKPTDFDPAKKYPALIYNYSGPGSQIVRNAWGGTTYLWHQLLAQKGYIVFGVDNRGTGGRGKAFKMATYKNLGDLESQDQIAAARWLAAQPYVDGKRIGIWGWSYGGYMATLAFLRGEGVFKVGMAVAPVADWRNYDTIYTERYMLTPEKNPEGYKKSSCLTYVDKLQGKLLLVHGTADDNVHFANTMQLAFALESARKPFDLMAYPRRLHGISGVDTRIHLFNLLTSYVLANL